VTGTKAELVLRVLDAFGLDAPTKAPAQLLRALLLERSTAYDGWDGLEAATMHLSVASCFGYHRAVFTGRDAVNEAKVMDCFRVC
jgi:hypothetical protein